MILVRQDLSRNQNHLLRLRLDLSLDSRNSSNQTENRLPKFDVNRNLKQKIVNLEIFAKPRFDPKKVNSVFILAPKKYRRWQKISLPRPLYFSTNKETDINAATVASFIKFLWHGTDYGAKWMAMDSIHKHLHSFVQDRSL